MADTCDTPVTLAMMRQSFCNTVVWATLDAVKPAMKAADAYSQYGVL